MHLTCLQLHSRSLNSMRWMESGGHTDRTFFWKKTIQQDWVLLWISNYLFYTLVSQTNNCDNNGLLSQAWISYRGRESSLSQPLLTLSPFLVALCEFFSFSGLARSLCVALAGQTQNISAGPDSHCAFFVETDTLKECGDNRCIADLRTLSELNWKY